MSIDHDALLSHTSFLMRIARSLLSDQDLVEEVVQKAMVEALHRPPRDANLLRPWLRKVVRNLALKELRGRKRRLKRESRGPGPRTAPPAVDVVIRARTSAAIARAVTRLNEPYRATVIARYYYELSIAEIADHESIPHQTVYTRLRRALMRLEADTRYEERLPGVCNRTKKNTGNRIPFLFPSSE